MNEFAEASDPIIVNQISGKLLQEFEVLTQCSKIKDEKILEEMHKLGIALWNVLVAKKTNKMVNSLASAKGTTKIFHKLTQLFPMHPLRGGSKWVKDHEIN